MKTPVLDMRVVRRSFLLIVLTIATVSSATASNLVFHLHCDKTTEAGEDEVYYLITSVKSDSSMTAGRLPGPQNHWDMNDGNKKPDVQNVILTDFSLSDGQSMKVVVTFMEEDGGTAFGWLDYAKGVDERVRKAGVSSPIPVTSFVDFIKTFLPDIRDTDDWIGTFQVDISQDKNGLKADWSAVQRSTYLGQSSGPKSNGFRFNGDGTNYYGWGQLNP